MGDAFATTVSRSTDAGCDIRFYENVAGTFTSLGGNNEEVVKLIRLTRLLKLLKLLRILRASRILSRFQTRYALTYTASEMAKYTLVIIVTLHWFACAWAALATFSLDQPRTPSLMEAVALQQSGARTRNGDDTWRARG